MDMAQSLTIRRARGEDARALLTLAGRDTGPLLTGDILLAEVGGRILAAIELGSGRVVADPFRPTADVVELLRVRAALLTESSGRGRGRRVLRSLPRPA